MTSSSHICRSILQTSVQQRASALCRGYAKHVQTNTLAARLKMPFTNSIVNSADTHSLTHRTNFIHNYS